MSSLAAMADVATGELMAAVWQGVLLAAVVGLALRLIPKTPAAVRFAIWFAVFLLVTGLPVSALWIHAASSKHPGGRVAWLTLDARWSVAIAAVWAVASLVRAGTLLAAAIRVRTLWKRAKPVDGLFNPEIESAVELRAIAQPGQMSLCRAWGTQTLRRAQICTSDEVDRPTVIGFFSPKILIPEWLLEKLTAGELKQIVLHETGHLGRADDWLNLLQKVALVVFPLNPALAWVERRLCFERELACDERVLRATQAPKAYAACLATIAEHRLGRRGLALALGALGRESELGRRVGRILRCGETMRPLHAKLVLGGAMLGLLGGAVGLERCPQVVGFAAAGTQSAAIVTPARAAGEHGRKNGYAYEAVSFHPDALRAHDVETAREAPSRVVANKAKGGSRACANGLVCTMKIREDGAHNSAIEAVQVRSSVTSPKNRRVHWVVVTTWPGEDGSRLVFTTATLQPRPPKVWSDVPAEPDEARALQEQYEQVHPYAAVPVRGGWLVFQL